MRYDLKNAHGVLSSAAPATMRTDLKERAWGFKQYSRPAPARMREQDSPYITQDTRIEVSCRMQSVPQKTADDVPDVVVMKSTIL